MSTFKSVVGSPFYGLGWIGGQVVNGFKAATTKTVEVATATTATVGGKVKAATAATAKTAKSAAVKTGEAAKAAATKTGKAVKGAAIKTTAAAKSASQTVAMVAVACTKAVGSAVGKVAAAVVTVGVTAVVIAFRTIHTIVWIAAQLAMLVAACVFAGSFLLAVAVFALAAIAFVAAAWVVKGVMAACRSVARWLTGPAGLTIANVLHCGSIVACFCAACWSIAAVLGLAFPVLGLAVAEATALGTAACWAALVGAATGVSAFLLESVSSEKVQVVYTPPTRRILPIDVYPGVVGMAPATA